MQVGSRQCRKSVLVAICLELYPICSASRARASCSLSCDKWKLHVGSSCSCSDAEECPSLLQQVADVCPLSEGQTLFTSSRVKCQQLSAGECVGHTWMHTHTTYICIPTHSHLHACMYTCAHTDVHTDTYMYTHAPTHVHTLTRTHTHSNTDTCTHTQTRTHTDTHGHTHAHARTHTHGHRHTQLCTLELYLVTYLDSLQRVLLCVHTCVCVCVCCHAAQYAHCYSLVC